MSLGAVMRPLLLLLAAFVLAAPSCAGSKGQAPAPQPAAAKGPNLLQQALAKVTGLFPKKSQAPAALPPQWTGTIRMVNLPERFVLIESAAVGTAIPGETYLAISKGTETASLRMTSLKNPPFLIADILTGSPSTGERIYRPKPEGQEAPPPAAPTPDQNPPKKSPSAES